VLQATAPDQSKKRKFFRFNTTSLRPRPIGRMSDSAMRPWGTLELCGFLGSLDASPLCWHDRVKHSRIALRSCDRCDVTDVMRAM
jgi:hypothetical protein